MHYFDADEFILLLVKYHDGKATKGEVHFIQERLKHSTLARCLWEDVQMTFAAEDKGKRNTPSPDGRLPYVRRSITVSHHLQYWLSAAALFILVATGGGLYFYLHSSRQSAFPAPSAKAVALQLAGGALIRLTGNKEVPAGGAGRFYNIDSILQSQTNRSGTALNTLSVPKGLTTAVQLPDGTKVYINSATVLRFPASFHKERRELYLEGEAYFMVAHDPSRPLVVHTTHADIVALGTSFNVNTYDGNLTAALMSGVVMVKALHKTVRLLPGQKVVRDMETGVLSVETSLNIAEPEWASGRYLFYNRRLSEVCRMMERLYDTEIVFDDTRIPGYHYTGAVNVRQPIESFAGSLSNMGKIGYYFDTKGRLHLTVINQFKKY